MSCGNSVAKRISRPVRGCLNSRMAACSACLPNDFNDSGAWRCSGAGRRPDRRPPGSRYGRDGPAPDGSARCGAWPRSGWRSDASGGPKRFSSQYSVTARLPLVWRTAMRLRSTGWRPIARVDRALLGLRRAPDQRLVDPGQVVGGKQLREAVVGGVVLGHHHDARRVLVEPVDDPRPPHAADAREAVAAMGQQGVDQRLVGVAGSGMDDQPGRLVEDEQIVILEQDIEVDRLRLGLGRLGRRNIDDETLAGFDLAGGLFYCRPPLV